MAFKQPLADVMRPTSLEQMVGQKQLLGPGRPLYQIITQHLSLRAVSLRVS